LNHDYRILLGVGAFLVVAGLVATAWTFVPYEGTKTRIIPIEPDFGYPPNPAIGVGLWTVMKISMWFQGEFSGTYVAPDDSQDNLGLHMIGQSAYDRYKETGSLGEELFSLHNNDTVSHVRLPTSGNYYIVLENNVPMHSEVNVTIHYRVSGVNLEFFAPGVALLLVACPVLFYASRWKKKGS